jgi:hypothetical protein
MENLSLSSERCHNGNTAFLTQMGSVSPWSLHWSICGERLVFRCCMGNPVQAETAARGRMAE